MSTLTFEQSAVLTAIESNPTGNIKDITELVKKSVVVTQSEVEDFIQALLDMKFIIKHNDCWSTTANRDAGAAPLKTKKLITAKKAPENHQKKDITMKPALLSSIESLRTKLEAKPPETVKQFEDKIGLLDALVDLPQIEKPLATILKEIKADLQAIQKAAVDAKNILES